MTKTVLITGAGKGLGRALALEFARKGYMLVLVSKTPADLKITAAIARKSGAHADYYIVDVTRLGEVERLKKTLNKKKQMVDILVNNAGIGFFGEIKNTDISKISSMMSVNYMGSVYFTKTFLDNLINRKGTVAFINTVAGKILVPKFGAYCPSKAALDFFGRALAKELKGKVKVVNIYPGPLKTAFWKDKSFNKLRRRFLFNEPSAVSETIVNGILGGKSSIVVPGWLNLLLLANKASSDIVYWLFKKIYKI
ncbi:SDR family NAD(P)-dependent oxidoreductase [Candidatus Woesearchaeota archaeon]|nr:SDR family NAD(P)-dependent oxidoreductase [Candidatus Woesearchaeota archaeon]